LLALYLEEWWATLSRFRVGAQRLRKSNKRKLRPLAASSAMALRTPYRWDIIEAPRMTDVITACRRILTLSPRN
jgi:hypothetical protein